MEPRIAILLGESAAHDRPTIDPISLLPPPSRPHPVEPTTAGDDAHTNADSLRGGSRGGTHTAVPQGASHRQKSSAPIAEVLNNGLPARAEPQLPGLSATLSIPPAFSGRLSDILLDPSQQHPNKRRKVDDCTTPPAPTANANENSLLTLPKLPQIPKKASRRPRIPPLLQGLHQPPPLPEGRLFPPITGEAGGSFGRDIGDGVGSRRPASRDEHTETDAAGESSIAADGTARAENNKGTIGRVTTSVSDKENHSQESVNDTPDKTGNKTKETKKRNKWSDQETKDLLHGVSQFGIGNWKKILTYPGLNFNGRTAVDLKDRFRTCCPGEGLKTRTPKSKAKSKAKEPSNQRDGTSSRNASSQEDGSQEMTATETSFEKLKSSRKPRADKHRKGPTQLAEMGIQVPFFKNKRRERREFTSEDDQNLLKGFEKYKAVWHAMRDDKELGFAGRHPTDLRDRFRIRYPEIYAKAGYKLKPRDEALLKEKEEADSQESTAATQNLQKPDTHESSQRISAPPLPAVTIANAPDANTGLRAHALLHPLMGSFDDFSDIISEDDGEGGRSPIRLSRNIFEWADANPSTTSFAMQATNVPPGAPSTGDTGWSTFPGMDGLHIDPRATLKLPMSSMTNTTLAAMPPFPVNHGHTSSLQLLQNSAASANTCLSNNTSASANPSSSVKQAMDALLRTPNLPTIVFPHVPVASARNAMHNLPPPADLLSGMEMDSRQQPHPSDFTLDDGFAMGFVLPSAAPTLAPMVNTTARGILNLDRGLLEEPFGDRSLLNSSI